MADQQQLMEDFAALPVTPASKSAFLAGLPLPGLVALLGDESRVELVGPPAAPAPTRPVYKPAHRSI